MLTNGVGVYSRKGGSGKTSLVTQVACGAARLGHRVLLVDLDSTGNLAQGLGYSQRTDHGMALAAAVMDGQPLEEPTVVDMDRGISVVCGGQHVDPMLAALMGGSRDEGHLLAALGNLAAEADLVFVDTPSTAYGFRDSLIRTVRYLVVPADADIGTVATFSQLVAALADQGAAEDLATVLGVVLVGFGARATITRRRIRDLYESPQLGARVYDTVLRAVPRVAADLRYYGVDVYTYAELARTERRETSNPTTWRLAASSVRLADEYRSLTDEILQSITAAQNGAS